MNTSPPDLSEYRGKHRLLLIFARSAEDENSARQRALLEDRGAALDDRDLLTLTFFEDDREGPAPPRREYGVGAGEFAAVLVGKDGGEKYRSGEPVHPEELFDLVDAMPMRRRELRNRNAL